MVDAQEFVGDHEAQVALHRANPRFPLDPGKEVALAGQRKRGHSGKGKGAILAILHFRVISADFQPCRASRTGY